MKLTCPSQDRISEYLEGSMNDTESEKILDHIEGCSNCDHVLTTMEGEQNDLVNEVCEFVRTERLLQEPEFEQLRNAAQFSQADKITSADVEEPLETGKRLRDYRLVKKIGEGGMGTVYQAVHIHLAKHVALKILPSDKLRSKQSVSRFRQEMRAVGKVNHPNVVSASDAGTIDGHHFLVMELVQGADLARIIHARGPLDVADACEIVRQTAIGLQHAHDKGLVHRDVKPSNIMLALDGSVKLLDLGLANLNNLEFESTANVVVTDQLTSVGQIMGTLDYMAPEQITASREVDRKADIYALGATLFQLLTGRTPCGDRSEATPERIEAVLHKPPLDILTLRSDVPEELCSLLQNMLAKNPAERPASAIDVAGELVRFASEADLGALGEACRTSLDMPSADVDVTDDVSIVVSRTESEDEVHPRRLYAGVALGGLFLAMLTAAIYFMVTQNGIVQVEAMDESIKDVLDGETVTVSDGESQPMPDKMQTIDVDFSPDVTKMLASSGQSEAEFRNKLHIAISQAAGIPNAQWKKFAEDPTGPPAIDGFPLSYLLLVRPTGPAPVTSETSDGFRMLGTRDLIFDAMSISKKIGYVSLIQPAYIKSVLIDIDAESQLLKGIVEYAAPKLYAGKVNFAARYQDGRVEVLEFTIPENRLTIARDEKAVWRASRTSAKQMTVQEMRELSRVKQVAVACGLFASRNGDMLPSALNQIVPDLGGMDLSQIELVRVEQKLSEISNPETVALVQSKIPLPSNQQAVAFVDAHAELIVVKVVNNPQTQPIVALFKAINDGDHKQLESVFSEGIRSQYEKEGWGRVLQKYQKAYREAFGEYTMDDFTFQYHGGIEYGDVWVIYKGKTFTSLSVIKENAEWKLRER